MSDYAKGAIPHTYHVVEGQRIEAFDGAVIDEQYISIYVNGEELATIMCSPLEQEALTLGFLFNEGVIDSLDDVGLIQANVSRTVVDVILNHSDFDPPRRMTITSGCGGGITLQHLTETHRALQSDFQTTSDIILERMRDLQGVARLYKLVRGVHTGMLANTEKCLVGAEDVGRHNTIDKIAGKALQEHIPTRDTILCSSGRISSEMLTKARRMEIPLVASRTAPTSYAVRLAEAWNICIVGYVRRGSMRVYTNSHRLGIK